MIPLLYAFVWSVLLSGAVAWHFIGVGWPIDIALLSAVAPYFLGALLGAWITLKIAVTFMAGKPTTARFSFFFSSLAIFTVGFTSLIFVTQALIFFSHGHAEIGSMMRMYQTLFTGLGSIVLMALTGLRPLLPWGIILLFLASMCFSRGWLSSSR